MHNKWHKSSTGNGGVLVWHRPEYIHRECEWTWNNPPWTHYIRCCFLPKSSTRCFLYASIIHKWSLVYQVNTITLHNKKHLLIFYHTATLPHKSKIYLRYIESGSYRGFLPQAIEHLKKYISLPDCNIFPWEVYTQHDIKLQRTKSSYKNSK